LINKLESSIVVVVVVVHAMFLSVINLVENRTVQVFVHDEVIVIERRSESVNRPLGLGHYISRF
jgi:hypothetical protein